MPRRASRVLPIQRLAAQARCTRCNDTGAVWVICPDAGAVKLPCDCVSPPAHVGGVQLVDAGLAAAFLACCGVAYFLI
ncbi:hypothetical protein EAH87_13135 [Sphingomonas koreensis]|nr:hypothetical protein EAH87_13135 [Sphingomonas koreensis]